MKLTKGQIEALLGAAEAFAQQPDKEFTGADVARIIHIVIANDSDPVARAVVNVHLKEDK